MDMTQILTIVFILASTLFTTCLWILGRKKEKRRSEEFVEIANDLQMTFSNKIDRSFRNQLKPFMQFSHGTIKNILHENKNNVEMVFFECLPSKRTERHGQDQRVMEGVFYFNSSTLNLPRFTLRAAEVLEQLFLGAFGVKDINFENYPVFSKKYLLTSDNEKAVKKLFNEELISFLEKLSDINIEGFRNQLIIYRPYTRIETSNFKQLKQEAVQIFEHSRK